MAVGTTAATTELSTLSAFRLSPFAFRLPPFAFRLPPSAFRLSPFHDPRPLLLDRIPVLATVDVLVAGAGTAGCCAALGARENGAASVLLLERYAFLGGTSTQMLDTFYGFFTPLAADGGARVRPRSPLQTRLRARGALLETPPDIAATGRADWHRNQLRQRPAS